MAFFSEGISVALQGQVLTLSNVPAKSLPLLRMCEIPPAIT
ncbi:hypothetical protein V0M98_07295 [Pseudomonas silesiensis]